MEKPIPFGNFTIIGNLAVGKTQLLNRLNKDLFSHAYDPTIGVDLRIINSCMYTLRLWEFSGNDEYAYIIRSKCKHYVGDSGVIVVYDVTNRESFNNLPIWIDIARYRTKNGDNSIIVVGN